MPEADLRPVALFAFYGVLSHGDSGQRFLRERIGRSRLRTALAVLLAPAGIRHRPAA